MGGSPVLTVKKEEMITVFDWHHETGIEWIHPSFIQNIN